MYAFLNRRVLCEYRCKFVLVFGDKQRFLVDEADEAGSSARGLLDEADGGVVDGDVRGAACLAEVRGDLRREAECLLARLTAARPQDDVRTGDVAHMQPDVRRRGGSKGERIILCVVLADQDHSTVGRGEGEGMCTAVFAALGQLFMEIAGRDQLVLYLRDLGKARGGVQ